jgi:uncharacterized protein (TIGR03435 family)
MLVSVAFAQDTPTSFEAVSVKPTDPTRIRVRSLRGGPGTNSPGRLSGVASMKALLMRAYDVKAYQIAGPSWMESERYEIDATIPAGATAEDARAMLRRLLTERFHLGAHRETKQLSIYALEAGKGATKLKEGSAAVEGTDAPVSPKIVAGADGLPELAAGTKLPRSYEIVVGGWDGIRYQLWARQETIEQLADRLSSQLDRPVIDRTGLKGRYDFALTWVAEGTGGNIPRTDPPPDMIESNKSTAVAGSGGNIFLAVQNQLGLRLRSDKGPITMLVVDRADRIPSGN